MVLDADCLNDIGPYTPKGGPGTLWDTLGRMTDDAKMDTSQIDHQSINQIQFLFYTGAGAHTSSRANRSTQGGAPALRGRLQLTVLYR